MRKLLLLLFFFPCVVSAAPCSNTSLGSGIVCVQSASDTTTTGATIAKAYPVNTTAGSLLTSAIGLTGPGGVTTSTTCTDTLGNTYKVVVVRISNVGNSAILFCYAENSIGGANTFTFNFPTSNNAKDLIITEFTGLASVTAYDVGSNGDGSGVNPTVSSGNITSTAATELQFSFAYDQSNNTDTFTPSAGFTLREQTSNSNTHSMASFDKVVTSTGTYSNSVSINNTSSALVVSLIGFKTTTSPNRTCSNSSLGLGVTCVQADGTWGFSVATLTRTFTNVAGHQLIYICGIGGSGTSSITDSNSNTIVPIDFIADSGSLRWAIVASANSGSNTVTCTTDDPTNSHLVMIVAEYSGLLGTIDQLNDGDSVIAQTSVTTGSVTPGSAPQLVLSCVLNADNSSSYLPSGGFAPEFTSASTIFYAPVGMTLGDYIVSPIAATTTTWSGSRGRLLTLIATTEVLASVVRRATQEY